MKYERETKTENIGVKLTKTMADQIFTITRKRGHDSPATLIRQAIQALIDQETLNEQQAHQADLEPLEARQ
jgi:metal-responsive CopG/Arc/MetJ family transcriptional regulator